MHRRAQGFEACWAAATLLVLFVAGCGDEREYRHESGLAIRIPDGWIETPTQDRGVTLSGPEESAEWRTTINVHATPLRSDEVSFRSLDGVVAALATKYRAMEAAQVRVGGTESVGGKDVRVVDLRFSRGGMRYRRVHYVARHRDRIVHLDGTAPQDSWDRLEPILERAVETASWE